MMKPNAKHKMDSRQIVPCLIVLSFFLFVFFHFIRTTVDQTGS